MSDLHDQALSDPSYEKRGVEAGRKNARRPLRHGDPDGTSVFDHGDRKRGPSDSGEFAGVVAAVSTGSKVSMFFCCPFDALGGTMATYAGQNVGAKKLDRVTQGLKAASLIGIIYSLIAFVILFFGGKYIALLFMDADQTEIIDRVAMFLIGNSMFYIPLTFVNVVRFTIQGMGFSTFAILAGVCEMAARSLVGFCLVPVFGFLPACFASPLAWIFADAFLIPAFFHCMKKLKVLFGEAA